MTKQNERFCTNVLKNFSWRLTYFDQFETFLPNRKKQMNILLIISSSLWLFSGADDFAELFAHCLRICKIHQNFYKSDIYLVTEV